MAEETQYPLCPFYGHYAEVEAKQLRSSGGNQCALIIQEFRPCYLSVDGHKPELAQCVLGETQRAQEFSAFKIIEPDDAPPAVTGWPR